MMGPNTSRFVLTINPDSTQFNILSKDYNNIVQTNVVGNFVDQTTSRQKVFRFFYIGDQGSPTESTGNNESHSHKKEYKKKY